MPFEKSKKLSEKLFVRRLFAILEQRNLSLREFAGDIGVSPASLSRLLSGDIGISPKIVARACTAIEDKAEAAELMKAFLTDQFQEIMRELPENNPWARKPIVTVEILLSGKS